MPPLWLCLILAQENSGWNEDSPYHDKTTVYVFYFSLRDIVENKEMMDANNIQVNVFYIYSPRKDFERQGKVWFTGTWCYSIQFTQRNLFNWKKKSEFIEQGTYPCFKTLYKYVWDCFYLLMHRWNYSLILFSDKVVFQDKF